MATNYTGNVTPSLSNAPANAWTDDATKASHVGNTYLVTGSGGTAGNVYAFEEYAAPLVKNASGLPADIVTITDGGENQPMVKAEVSLSPIQSLNGYDHPWAGGAGKNKLDTSTITVGGITFTQDSDGYVTASPNTGDSRSWGYSAAQYKVTLPAGTYKFVFDIKTASTYSGRGYRVVDSDGNILVGGYTTAIDTSGASSAFTLSATTSIGVMVKMYEMKARFMIVASTETNTWSPYENLCPITGHDSATLYRTGKNLLDGSAFTTYSNWKSTLVTYGNYNTTSQSKGFELKLKSGVTYTLSFGINSTTFPTYLYLCRANGTVSERVKSFSTTYWQASSYTLTPEEGWMYYLRMGALSSQSAFDTQMGKISYAQLELASSASSYTPYVGASYPVTFPQTVYGGTFDWVSGKLKVTMANIASYNGETIGEPWLSSMDAYVAGATPTTGAQVVHTITPTETTLTPAQVQTLLGLNNVWASDGQISALTYKSNQFVPKYDWFETWTMPKITRNNGTVIVLPYPQEYTPEIYDVDASTTGRNAAGTMIRDRVARKHKFNYKFPPLSRADATEILGAVQDVSFTLTTASPETGAKTNYRVYVGDRSLPVYWMPTHDNASWLYSSLSLNLIEM